MLFKIKKVFNVNANEDFENSLYDFFMTQCSDVVVTKEENEIIVKPKSQWGLYFNSFRPKIYMRLLNAENTLSVTFELQLFTKVVCFLIWAVGLFYGCIIFMNDKNVIGAIVPFASIAVISYLFAMKGLSLGSLKYTNAIEKIITQYNKSAKK